MGKCTSRHLFSYGGFHLWNICITDGGVVSTIIGEICGLLQKFSTACKFRMDLLKSSYLMKGLYIKDARTRCPCDCFSVFFVSESYVSKY